MKRKCDRCKYEFEAGESERLFCTPACKAANAREIKALRKPYKKSGPQLTCGVREPRSVRGLNK